MADDLAEICKFGNAAKAETRTQRSQPSIVNAACPVKRHTHTDSLERSQYLVQPLETHASAAHLLRDAPSLIPLSDVA